jgi:hypothetical protein
MTTMDNTERAERRARQRRAVHILHLLRYKRPRVTEPNTTMFHETGEGRASASLIREGPQPCDMNEWWQVRRYHSNDPTGLK